MKECIPILFLFLFSGSLLTQNVTVTGSVERADNNIPIPLATVELLKISDSASVKGVVTNSEGVFNINDVVPSTYILKVQYLGYESKYLRIKCQDSIDLDPITLSKSSQLLDEVVIEREVTTGQQRGDTTQYNAGAFTTLPDASGQELIEKMPGILIIDGQIQALGENIQQVLVDGKPFFGSDVNTALQSIPAEIIQNIEIYNEKSEKAELTGFDDGEEQPTINIVTKPNRKRGQFGKVTGGYGTGDKYQVGASVNLFSNASRFTVTGLSNNINAVEYSADPNSQGEVRTQDGLITTNDIALQYGNEWNNNLELSSNYHFTDRKNQGMRIIRREFTIPSQDGQVYKEISSQNRQYRDHDIEAEIEYDINDNNRLVIEPDFSFQRNFEDDSFEGETSVSDGLINETSNTNSSDNLDYDFEGEIFYGHKFRKKGRSFAIESEWGVHSNRDDENRRAQNVYYEDEDQLEQLYQIIERERTGLSYQIESSYSEPFGKNGMVELEYEFANRKDDSDKLNFNIDEGAGMFDEKVLDTSLSNVFESEYLTHQTELGYQYEDEVYEIEFELEYQIAKLNNDQEFPGVFNTNRRFASILPSFEFEYNIEENKELELEYRTSTDEPAIAELQNVIDNSNPLRLRTGNPDLQQSYRHWVRTRYRSRNPETEKSLYFGASFSVTEDLVTNSIVIADKTTEINDDITLQKGAQFVRPLNIDGYWDIDTYISYGMPLKMIKSNFNLWGGVEYARRPGMINRTERFTNSTEFSLGVSLSSNINDRMDFNVSTRSSYNLVNNNLQPDLDNNYYVQSSRLSYDWVFWNGFTYRTDVRHRLNGGLDEDFENSYFLVNMSIGKKFLNQNRGELSLNVYDLLDQNNNISRDVTELYIEDRRGTVLQRYFMVSFTYNIRHFSKGSSMDDFDM